jgi:hypothetical protein
MFREGCEDSEYDSSHQLLKTLEQLQKFRISGQRPSCNSKVMKDQLHTKQEMMPHIPHEDLGKKKPSAKSVSHTHG